MVDAAAGIGRGRHCRAPHVDELEDCSGSVEPTSSSQPQAFGQFVPGRPVLSLAAIAARVVKVRVPAVGDAAARDHRALVSDTVDQAVDDRSFGA
jgi:hypothetical protein